MVRNKLLVTLLGVGVFLCVSATVRLLRNILCPLCIRGVLVLGGEEAASFLRLRFSSGNVSHPASHGLIDGTKKLVVDNEPLETRI